MVDFVHFQYEPYIKTKFNQSPRGGSRGEGKLSEREAPFKGGQANGNYGWQTFYFTVLGPKVIFI